MTNFLKIPAGTKAYLHVVRDSALDKFDVKKFAYDFPLIVSKIWAYWKFNDVIVIGDEDRIDSSGNSHDFHVYATWPNTGEYYGGGGVAGGIRRVLGGFYKNDLTLVPGTSFDVEKANFDLDVDLTAFGWDWSIEPDETSVWYGLRYQYQSNDGTWSAWWAPGPAYFIKDDAALPPWKRIDGLYPSNPTFKNISSAHFRVHIINDYAGSDTMYFEATDRYVFEPRGKPDGSPYPGSDTGKVGDGVTEEIVGQRLYQNAGFPVYGGGREEFTYLFWVNLDGDGMRIYSNVDIKFLLSGGHYKLQATIGDLTVEGAYDLDPNVWCFIAVYYDGTALHAEVNNSEIDSATGAHNLTEAIAYFTIEPIKVWPEGDVCMIDEFGVWTYALSATERSDWYNGGTGRTL